MLSKRHGAAHAQKGPVPATRWWRKKERNHLRVTSGKAAFCGEAVALHGAPQFSQTQGLDSYSPLFSSEAGARLLSAHTRLARAAAAAAAVIPSILNLTSSHTRDEVIAGSARHVRGARIGRQAPGGGTREARGAGAGRAGQGGAGSVCAARGSLRSLRRPRLESSRSEKRRPRRRPAGWGLVGPCTVAAEAIVTAFLASGSRGRQGPAPGLQWGGDQGRTAGGLWARALRSFSCVGAACQSRLTLRSCGRLGVKLDTGLRRARSQTSPKWCLVNRAASYFLLVSQRLPFVAQLIQLHLQTLSTEMFSGSGRLRRTVQCVPQSLQRHGELLSSVEILDPGKCLDFKISFNTFQACANFRAMACTLPCIREWVRVW